MTKHHTWKKVSWDSVNHRLMDVDDEFVQCDVCKRRIIYADSQMQSISSGEYFCVECFPGSHTHGPAKYWNPCVCETCGQLAFSIIIGSVGKPVELPRGKRVLDCDEYIAQEIHKS